MTENKTIFITGAAGFIGFHVSRTLLKNNNNIKIVGLDNINDYYDVKLKYYRLEILKKYDNFTFIKDDLANKARKKKNGSTVVSFSISDCPLWLYKWFLDDKNRYNDVYWVRLKEVHDIIMMQEIVADQTQQPVKEEVSEKEEKIKKSYLVKTFRDTEEVKIEKDEKVEEDK